MNSLARLASQKAQVAETVSTSSLKRGLSDLTRPPSPSGNMRKAGIALIASPDPFTGVPGVALLAASFVVEKKGPANIGDLASETRRVLREIQSLGI